MVDQNIATFFSSNKPLESNVLDQQNASEKMQSTTFQMTPNEQNTTASMVNQQLLEERNRQQRPWFHLGWNHVPKMQQHQHLRNRMNPQCKIYHSKNLIHENHSNQSSSQDQQNQNFDSFKQETYNDWQPNIDPRLQNTSSNVNNKNNDNSFHSHLNQNTFNLSSVDAFPNLHNESYQGTGKLMKERSQNGTDVGFDLLNMNPLLYPQIVAYDINNDINALQPGLMSNSTKNSSRTTIKLPQERQSNFQYIPQEQELRHNLGFQRNSNPTYNNCSLQKQGLESNLEVERDCNSMINSGRHFQEDYISSSIVQETPNVEFKPQCLNLQDVSSNMTSKGTRNREENNFQHNGLRSQGLLSNLNYTLNPPRINTTFNPHSALPTLDISLSPAFYNSPSTLPTTPKPQGAQCIDKTNILNPSQIMVMANETCNISITKFTSDPCLNFKNYSRQHHYMCSDAHPSTPNDNPIRDITPNHCSPHQHQGHSFFDQVQVSHDTLESCAIRGKCNHKKNILRRGTRESNECNRNNDCGESSSPSTKKKSMNIASKELEIHRNCCQKDNYLDNIPMWIQKTIVLPAQHRGCHNITHLV